MKATGKRSKNAKGKLSGDTYEVINSLAAILTLTSVKSSPAERRLIGKEFARTYDLLSDRLAKIHYKDPPAKRKRTEQAAEAVAEKVSDFTARIGVCCVGCKGAVDREACKECNPEAIWACKEPEPIDPEI